MKQTFLTVATLLLLASCGGGAPQSDNTKAPKRHGWYEDIPLYGDVERVCASTHIEATFEDKSTASHFESEYCYTFNERGDVAERVEYCDMGNSATIEQSQIRCQYIYDEAGRMVEERWHDKFDNLDWKGIYKYSPQGVLIEEISYRNGDTLQDRTLYKYDAQGKKTTAEHYNAEGILQWTTRYKHNSNGLLVEETAILTDGTIDHTAHYAYDAKGNLIERSDMSEEKSDEICERKFDSKGNIVEEFYYTKGDNSCGRRVKYEITYRK